MLSCCDVMLPGMSGRGNVPLWFVCAVSVSFSLAGLLLPACGVQARSSMHIMMLYLSFISLFFAKLSAFFEKKMLLVCYLGKTVDYGEEY